MATPLTPHNMLLIDEKGRAEIKPILPITLDDFPINDRGLRGIPKCCGMFLHILTIYEDGCYLIAQCPKCDQPYLIGHSTREELERADGEEFWRKPLTDA